MTHAINVFDLMSIESDLRIPQSLLVGYVGNVEEQTKSIVILEASVYVAFYLEEKR
jgi:hypothetical protein